MLVNRILSLLLTSFTLFCVAASTQAAGEIDARAAPKPGTSFRDCSSVCPEMVWLPKGGFWMGGSIGHSTVDDYTMPRHRVHIGYPLAVGKYPVTFDEWDACVSDGGCNGYKPSNDTWPRHQMPVFHVSWRDAQAYVQWLSKKTGKQYRLLSEAEREYAIGFAYARKAGRRHDGNYDETEACLNRGWGQEGPCPVGSFPPNTFGLYDVIGNVQDWVEDCYHDSYRGAPTDGRPRITKPCEFRVLRGAGWSDGIGYPFARARGDESGRDDNHSGFRVARTSE